MEKELSEWKVKFRKLQDGEKAHEQSTENSVPAAVQDNVLVTSHVQSLNNTIGNYMGIKKADNLGQKKLIICFSGTFF